MTKDEALKLALMAFEEINKLSVGENAICLPAEIDTAMDSCREALAQPEQEPVAYSYTSRVTAPKTSEQGGRMSNKQIYFIIAMLLAWFWFTVGIIVWWII